MKTIIAGGRDFNDVDFFMECMHKYDKPITEVVCGMAKGADTLGKDYAITYFIPIAEFPADWARYGNGAGPIRNKQMADNADALIAFWDGRSKGTWNMIQLAQKFNLKVTIYNYET